jgi:RNA polymerase sigma-70 factor (ECF subfamily)
MAFPPLTIEEQASLVGRIRNGDEQAEAHLVELFSRSVQVMVRGRAGRRLDADDLTQDVLMAAITAVRRGQLRDIDRLGAFVAGIARNVINDRLRRTQGAFEPLAGHEKAAIGDLREEVARRDRVAALRRGLEQLSAEDRRILMLTLIDGLRAAEIAAQMGVTEDVVRARKSRALKRLKGHVDI